MLKQLPSYPFSQASQCPQQWVKGTITKSPGFMSCTSAPTSSMMPIASWPTSVLCGRSEMPRNHHRSEPHTHALSTRTIASVGFSILGRSTSRTPTCSGSTNTAAFIMFSAIVVLSRSIRSGPHIGVIGSARDWECMGMLLRM